MFAARAGAARVYAVERTTVAVLARDLAAANGLAEIIEVIHGDVLDVELPEPVDVIVSEWLGGFGIDEGMLAPVIAARDRWLKPGGTMIPQSVTAWAALVHDRQLDETMAFLRGQPVRPHARQAGRADGQRDLVFRDVPSPGGGRQALGARPAVDDGRRPVSLEEAETPTRPRRCCTSSTTGPPTHSRSGSVPTSRPAFCSPSGPAIRRPTGG